MIVAVAAIFVCLGFSNVEAQLDEAGRWENGITEAWRYDTDVIKKDEIIAANSRWESVAADDRDEAADEWTGDYYRGSRVHGTFLRWSPRSGFVMVGVDECAATIMDLRYGNAASSQTLVQFFPEFHKNSRTHGHASRGSSQLGFVPVKWRGVHYLIEESDMKAFGDWYSGLGNNSSTDFWMAGLQFFAKSGDKESRTADEPPVVPAGYERFLKKPIDAQIIFAGKRVIRITKRETYTESLYRSFTTVTINVGRVHGVKPGMSFHLLTSGHSDDITITSVSERSAIGSIERFLEEQPNKPPTRWSDKQDSDYIPIVIGSRVTTSLHKVAAMNGN
jgi:hypothetical protein